MEHMKSGTILPVFVFRNLISIELCFDNYFSVWDGVLEVLSYCPKLQNLAIEKPAFKGLYKDGVLVELPYRPMLQTLIDMQFHKEKWAELVPECVSLHLTTCSIRNYRGWDDDFKFAEFILQNVSFLQTMTLHSAPSRKEEKQWVFKHLSWCPRISTACKIFLNAEKVNQQEHENLIIAP
ncbi:uncharacterized protein LOC130733930 [Lotus japonicus]|uniref:uncharacterized protein LOC130733930 n=1 Tax=Lotus japonicus TaxID=34305 RepID=UPI0025895804|nr:uncharacterized protein LOC130733930 [Lotus japonicus]XP_057442204.1 uncharacterized protein LOC130733930 [Lotus japonicus]